MDIDPSRFAHPLTKGTTLRGKSVMTYGNTIEDALTNLEHCYQATFRYPSRRDDHNTAQQAAALTP